MTGVSITIATLSGCAGVLNRSDSNEQEDPTLSIDIEEAEQEQYGIYASIDYNDAKGISFLYEGGNDDEVYSPRVNENPEEKRLYELVEPGTVVEIVAYFGEDWDEGTQVGEFEVNGEQSIEF